MGRWRRREAGVLEEERSREFGEEGRSRSGKVVTRCGWRRRKVGAVEEEGRGCVIEEEGNMYDGGGGK